MKKLLSTIITLLSCLTANAQAPNWLWAKGAGGIETEWGQNTTVDNSGNVYVIGSFFSSSITFGTNVLVNANTTGISSDIFLVKYDPSGNVLWANQFGSIGNDRGTDIALDFQGNIFITGYFDSPNLTFGTVTLNNVDTSDIFIVKFSSTNNVLWAKSKGGMGADLSYSVATDFLGNAFITGEYSSVSLSFGSGSITNMDNSGASSDIFTFKYDSQGNEIWAKSIGSSDFGWASITSYLFRDYSASIATDLSGNIYITGTFASSSFIFGTDSLDTYGNGDHFFVIKYGNAGNEIWAKSEAFSMFGGLCNGKGIATDAAGNVFITGDFAYYYLIVDSDTLEAIDETDIFIAKFDSIGNLLWLQGGGGTGFDYGYGITTDVLGNVYATGIYSISCTFDSVTLLSGSSFDVFVVKLNTNGNALWLQRAYSSWHDAGYSIVVDQTGNVYVAGSYAAMMFLGTNTLNFSGATDMFIAKLSPTLVNIVEFLPTNHNLVYPNPSNGVFSLNDNKNINNVEVYNILGEQILTQGNQKQINLSEFARGIYFARINGETVLKLVKD
jgi:hypothetical protein